MTHIRNNYLLSLALLLCSCSYITGPEGLYPERKHKFFDEEINQDIQLTNKDLNIMTDDHYPPIINGIAAAQAQDVPVPRQIFSSAESSEVQLRRLGELMWIYAETLPSSAWPVVKNYIEASPMSILGADPDTGIIDMQFSEELMLRLTVEHGIKEASSEIFLSAYELDGTLRSSIDPVLIKNELEKILQFFVNNSSSFSGTSLAAQSLNDRKKVQISNLNNKTIIQLDLGFDRAWSAVSRALTDGEITSNDIDREAGIFLVSYSIKSESNNWFGFLNFTANKDNNSLLIKEQAEFKIILNTTEEGKTNILVESLAGSLEDAEALISKINELLS